MKPGPVIAMVGLIFLGMWLVWLRPSPVTAELREGAKTTQIRLGQSKGVVEVVEPGEGGGTPTYRVLWTTGAASEALSEAEFERVFGKDAAVLVRGDEPNFLFRIFNITSWSSMIWVGIGLGGQIVFSCRFIVQWIISERRRESVIPTVFWWISLGGAVCLFTYFVWRQDVVGVLGQSSGLVIYARNLRLIKKQQRRARRAREGTTAAALAGSENPADPSSNTPENAG